MTEHTIPGTSAQTEIGGASDLRLSGTLQVIVAGRAEKTVRDLVEQIARNSHYSVSSRLITNGHADPLHGVEDYPEALVVVLSAAWKDELEALASRPAAGRPPSLIVGIEENPLAMRMAMRAGAREFLKWPEQVEDVRSALALIANERTDSVPTEQAQILTVINAKGGSGATFIATSLAHIMTSKLEFNTTLIDLELQFASIGSYFDIELRHGLVDVLEAVPDMDDVALSGYLTEHSSGLKLLGARGNMIGLSEEVDAMQFAALLELLQSSNQRVVIDAPRHLNQLTIQALEMADKIVIVLQQNLPSLKDAIRLLAILRNDMAIAKDRIFVAINRFDNESEISYKDIKTALCVKQVYQVYNDFSTVNECLNSGVPIYEAARKSKIAKSLIALSYAVEGRPPETSRGTFVEALQGVRRMIEGNTPK